MGTRKRAHQRVLYRGARRAGIVVLGPVCLLPPHDPVTHDGHGPLRVLLFMQESSKVPVPQVLPQSVDRRLYSMIHGLPHSPAGDRYVAILSDLGEGLGWVGAGVALAWLGGRKGRRAGVATVIASLGTTYLVQHMVKPVFRRSRPHVGRDITVVGLRTTDASFPSGHAASSFAAATTLSTFYPVTAPLVFMLAAGVGASRVHLGHHFPSDVAAGGLLGMVTGALTGWMIKTARVI